ncbi:MAG: FtsQ-type POTRA domain-containing protein [Gaiellaceae bacterium]
MARRHALALVHPRSAPALAALPRRALVAGVSLVAGIGLLYLGARETPLFALEEVTVAGAPPAVRTAILRETGEARGESLVALDGSALVRRLEALPSVLSVRYDRAFPHTLRLFVQPERPLAVVREGTSAWVVSERGRVIREAEAGKARAFPKIRLPAETRLTLGAFIADPGARTVLRALAELPGRFPLRVHAARFEGGELTFVLAGTGGIRPELRLGEPTAVGVKLAAAGLVLRSLHADERASLGYLDVSLPDRPVAGSNSQVST